MSKPGADPSSGISVGEVLSPRGIRHIDGAKLNLALVGNVRTYTAMLREKAQSVTTARPKVPMRRLGAHCLVVAMKRGNARGAKGVGHQRWIGSTGVGSTGSGRNLIINGRRQPSHGGTSRMMREYHVRICEGLGVQLPGSTRHLRDHRAELLAEAQAIVAQWEAEGFFRSRRANLSSPAQRATR